tara:strand:+ start:341 stop:2236 length:1896 start_codon:yes stop_codon:yes gene_type:complete
MASQSYKILIKAKDQASGTFKKLGGAAKGAAGAVGSVAKVALGATAAVAALGTTIAVAAKHSFDFADKIGKVATRTGIATDTIQAFQIAAIESGSTMDIANKSLEKFTRSVGDAQRGLKTQADIFRDLGVSITDANGNTKDMDTLLREVSDGMSKLGSQSEKATVAANLFGRAGIQVVDVLDNGAAAFDAYIKKAQDYGLILDEKGIRKSEKFNDTLALIKRQFMVIKTVISIAFLPILQTLATNISETTKKFATQEGSVEDLGVAIRDKFIAGLLLSINVFADVLDSIQEFVGSTGNATAEVRKFFLQSRMFAADINNLFGGIDVQDIEDAAERGIKTAEEFRAGFLDAIDEIEHEGIRDFFKQVNRDQLQAIQDILDIKHELIEIEKDLKASAESGEKFGDGLREKAKQLQKTLEEMIQSGGTLPEFLEHVIKVGEEGGKAVTDLLSPLDRLKQEFDDQGFSNAIDTIWVKSFNDAADALTNFVETGKLEFKDFVQSILRDLVRLQIRMALFGIFFGGNSTITANNNSPLGYQMPKEFSGGGYTGMGARAGGLDGKGGFLAMLHPQETVLDHTKGQGGVIINQTVSFATGVQDTVRNEVLQLLPDIAESSKGAVFEAMGRGGAFRRGMK